MYVVLWTYTSTGHNVEEKWNLFVLVYKTMNEAWKAIDEYNKNNKGSNFKFRIMRLEEVK